MKRLSLLSHSSLFQLGRLFSLVGRSDGAEEARAVRVLGREGALEGGVAREGLLRGAFSARHVDL